LSEAIFRPVEGVLEVTDGSDDWQLHPEECAVKMDFAGDGQLRTV
jgi:hypothetical protein